MRLVHAALLVQHSPAGRFGGIIGLQEGVRGFLGSFSALRSPSEKRSLSSAPI
jgi:hypothetical protein